MGPGPRAPLRVGGRDVEQGRSDEAQRSFERALAIAREVGDRRSVANVLGNLGNLLADLGQPDAAQAHYASAHALHRDVGNRRHEGILLGNLAGLQFDRGQVEEARVSLEAAIAIAREVGDRRTLAKLLCRRGSAPDLAEARALADALGLGPDSDLRKQLSAAAP